MSPVEQDPGEWLRIIRGEFSEMPGLQLTHAQASRLWGLDAQSCTSLLSTLVRETFLRLTADGRYARASADEARAPSQIGAGGRSGLAVRAARKG